MNSRSMQGTGILRPRAGPVMFVMCIVAAIAAGRVAGSGGFPALADFITVFFSILLEAFPFILLGTTISSAINLFVTPEIISRFMPRSRILGSFLASLLGFAFPICECANVPVMRRLVAKGMPIPIAVTFLLSVAIVNPVVLFSTWVAFGGDWKIVLLRGGFGMLVAIVVGNLAGLFEASKRPLKVSPGGTPHAHGQEADECCGHEIGAHGASCPGCGHDHGGTGHATDAGRRAWTRVVVDVLEHTGTELFSVGRYMISGAAVAALMQTILPRSILVGVGTAPFISILVLMALAYLLSLCSEADAFIAASFSGYFTQGAIVAFLVFGPMMDVKNTLMLLDGFKPKFVLVIVVLVTVACCLAGVFVNGMVVRGVMP